MKKLARMIAISLFASAPVLAQTTINNRITDIGKAPAQSSILIFNKTLKVSVSQCNDSCYIDCVNCSRSGEDKRDCVGRRAF